MALNSRQAQDGLLAGEGLDGMWNSASSGPRRFACSKRGVAVITGSVTLLACAALALASSGLVASGPAGLPVQPPVPSSASSTPAKVVTVPAKAMEHLISEQVMTCVDTCNKRLKEDLKKCVVGKQGCKKPANVRHLHCCSSCPEKTCEKPVEERQVTCSATCNKALKERMALCKTGVQGCRKGANHHHVHCCETCPSKKCDE